MSRFKILTKTLTDKVTFGTFYISHNLLIIHNTFTVLCRLVPDFHVKQGVALTVRNRTGPPWSVGCPAGHAPGNRPACPPAALQTPTDDDCYYSVAPYITCRRASNQLMRLPVSYL